MALVVSGMVPRRVLAGVRYRFPLLGLRAIEMETFADGSMALLTRRTMGWLGGYVEVLWMRSRGAPIVYRLYDRGELHMQVGNGRWHRMSLSLAGTRLIDQVRFTFTRDVPGQPSLWMVTWIPPASDLRSAEDSIVVTRHMALRVSPQHVASSTSPRRLAA